MGAIAIVTGGGSGLGEACARKLADIGAEVWLLDLNISAAEAASECIRAAGGTAYAMQIDVSDPTAVEEASFASKLTPEHR